MKNILYSLTALAFLTSAVTHTAALDEAKPAKKDFTNVKIAVVDMYAVFDKSKEGADLQESIKADVEKRLKNLQTLQAEYTKIKDELEKGASTMSEDALKKRQVKLMSLQNEIQMEQNEAQTAPQKRAQDAQMAILKKIENATQKVAKANGIDIVIAGSTIYVADRVDITQLIVDDLNSSYKPAPKPAAAAKK